MVQTILEHWGITAEALTLIINENPSIRGMIFGYVAEFQLREYVKSLPGITGMWKEGNHDRRHKGDLYIIYRGERFSIESKSLQTNMIAETNGVFTVACQCDKSDSTPVILPNGDEIRTTCLAVGGFDVLAVNLFPILGQWRFIFALNDDLPRSTFRGYTPEQRRYILKSLIPVTWPIPEGDIFTTDLESLLGRLMALRKPKSRNGSF